MSTISSTKTSKLFFLFLLTSLYSWGQLTKGEYINISVGLGVTSSNDVEIDLFGNGFHAQAEYIVSQSKWFSMRPYLGFVYTSTSKDELEPQFSDSRISTRAVFFGGKIRLCAPIPYIAPYIDLGIGGALGSFKTISPFSQVDKDGFVLHIPFTLGLALGRNHNTSFEFTYYFHLNVNQFSGALALGATFPID
ncbi:hypothetical protein NBT05_13540 [Aquimarina sp. ERC-38]|uniref:hypothetical protein n=1 Tax=Aquimarina sp. ERC-38 TaxID=2949996 RepID=UPI0022465A0A|nr:hypothetical protein [Aquimarina sp. ERC-38]UZO79968.1 hypothetical protein NBT05_13540 [Aquimarina sp. ERC-38]